MKKKSIFIIAQYSFDAIDFFGLPFFLREPAAPLLDELDEVSLALLGAAFARSTRHGDAKSDGDSVNVVLTSVAG